MRNFLKEFGQVHSDALDYLKKKLEEKNEIVLVDIEDDEQEFFPDEFYELPSQHVYNRHGLLLSYRIWRLRITDGVMFADGYSDEDSPSDWEFEIEKNGLNWDCVIELTTYI